jgi:heme exporter protein D
VLLLRAGITFFGWLFIALAVIAVVDLVVVQLRRRARRHAEGDGHSLFE